MIVTFVYPAESENWESIEWRCHVPAAAINRTGVHKANVITDIDFSYNSDECITTCLESDVIVIYKKIYGRVISAIHHWQARDKIIVVDFDEAFQLLDHESDQYKFWFEGIQYTKDHNLKYISPAPMTQFKWGLKLVDGITVSSDRLADDWMSFNEIGVIHDYINVDSYIAVNKKRKNGDLIFGWHGKNLMLETMLQAGTLEALNVILDTFPDITARFYVDDQLVLDSALLKREQILIIEDVTKSIWLEALTEIDIGILPLISNFDQRKSLRTVLEYLVMKIPWLASQNSIYYDIESYGQLVLNTKAEWEQKLKEIIHNYDIHKSNAAQEPFLFGLGKSADENIHRSINLYKKFIAAKWR
ncbi:MAG: hypothetical protein JEZ00_00690 [Anaerolineaceae bacterium]|nr:hypothetical protein [Anaerolineaceae bacterium]